MNSSGSVWYAYDDFEVFLEGSSDFGAAAMELHEHRDFLFRVRREALDEAVEVALIERFVHPANQFHLVLRHHHPTLPGRARRG